MTASHCSSVRGMHMRSVSQTSDPCHAGCSDSALKLTGCSNLATCKSTAVARVQVPGPRMLIIEAVPARGRPMHTRQVTRMSNIGRRTSLTRTVQNGLKPMLQPDSGLFGGVTQCLLLKSGSHAVASGIGSAMTMANSHVSDWPYVGYFMVSTACQYHAS